jgi:hypothetical protein
MRGIVQNIKNINRFIGVSEKNIKNAEVEQKMEFDFSKNTYVFELELNRELSQI